MNLGKPGVVAFFWGKSEPDSIDEFLADILHEWAGITNQQAKIINST